MSGEVGLLVSYFYFNDFDLSRFDHLGVPLFADSGAFTAYQKRKTIDVYAYMKWLDRWRSRFTVYANLDRIGDWRGTADNMTAMERSGFTPMPVFHRGEPWEVLDALVERHEYIALGGLHGAPLGSAMRYAIECFRRAKPTTKYHGFAVTRALALKSFPWHSVDSTTWIAGQRFGNPIVPMPNGDLIQTRKIKPHFNALRTARVSYSKVLATRDPKTPTIEALRSTIPLYVRRSRQLRRMHGSALTIYLALGVGHAKATIAQRPEVFA